MNNNTLLITTTDAKQIDTIGDLFILTILFSMDPGDNRLYDIISCILCCIICVYYTLYLDRQYATLLL